MTSKQRTRVLILLGVTVIVALFWYLAPGREPSYKGKSLSEWVSQSGNYPWLDSARTEALQHMGTNALPFLLNWLHASPATNDGIKGIKSFVTNLPPTITPTTLSDWAQHDRKLERAIGSAYAIGDLGGQAQVVIPVLTAMMNATNADCSSEFAIVALGGIGKPAIPVLTEALANTNHPHRLMLIEIFGWPPALYTNAVAATSAVPLLVNCLGDANTAYRFHALRSLGRMGEYDRSQAELVVPALEKCLSAANPSYVRSFTVTVLATYERQDKTILPLLVESLSDFDPRVRLVATNVISKIAPWTLTNFPALKEERPRLQNRLRP